MVALEAIKYFHIFIISKTLHVFCFLIRLKALRCLCTSSLLKTGENPTFRCVDETFSQEYLVVQYQVALNVLHVSTKHNIL